MTIKQIAAKWFAAIIAQRTRAWAMKPEKTQEAVFNSLISAARNTQFGRDHHFGAIRSYEDFAKQVPVRDYEALKGYVDLVVEGKADVLWPGKPHYFAKTSGTTSGAKFIPITKESMPYHISAARNAILHYIYETGNAGFVDGKMIFLQGSPILKEKHGIKIGRLSGIVAHFVPKYLQKNRLPSWETNCIEDWETKVDAIVGETIGQDMAVISGIPSWVQMYFERLKAKSGKPVGELFPNFSLFIYGGVNFEPYRPAFSALIGREVDSIELFPASEGFFAYQDSRKEKGMLLLLNSGIFYEFIRADEFFGEYPKRLTIGEVETGVNYVMIISTNAGLWAYNIGDTVMFTTLRPHRVVVTGRIKHYISAFGEHVIGKEVETAMESAIGKTGALVREFTVAPQIVPESGLPYHEWLIEFEKEPQDMVAFVSELENSMRTQNIYYDDLITGKVLRTLVVTKIPAGGFVQYMKSVGRLGGQNKLPRLCNDRSVADALPKSGAYH